MLKKSVFLTVILFFILTASFAIKPQPRHSDQSFKSNLLQLENLINKTMDEETATKEIIIENSGLKIVITKTNLSTLYWETATKTLTIFNFPVDTWEIRIKKNEKNELDICFAIPTEAKQFMEQIFKQYQEKDSPIVELTDFPLKSWGVTIEDANQDGQADNFTLNPPEKIYELIVSLFEKENNR